MVCAFLARPGLLFLMFIFIFPFHFSPIIRRRLPTSANILPKSLRIVKNTNIALLPEWITCPNAFRPFYEDNFYAKISTKIKAGIYYNGHAAARRQLLGPIGAQW
jgi:hypothetical protein